MSRPESTKDRILNQSAHLFARYGYQKISMRDIAKAVGIQASSIYNHYPSKESILDEILKIFEKATKAYYPTPDEIEQTIHSETDVCEILSRYVFEYRQQEQEFMVDALAIVMREHFNHPSVHRIFQSSMLDLQISVWQMTLQRLIDVGRMSPTCNSHDTAIIWTYTYLGLALEAARMLAAYKPNKFSEIDSIPAFNFFEILKNTIQPYILDNNESDECDGKKDLTPLN